MQKWSVLATIFQSDSSIVCVLVMETEWRIFVSVEKMVLTMVKERKTLKFDPHIHTKRLSLEVPKEQGCDLPKIGKR